MNASSGPARPNRAGSGETAHARAPRVNFKMAAIQNNVQKKQKKETKHYFRWSPGMIENLIDCLSSYKSIMEYRSLDFDADKPAQYKHLRKEMAKLYADEDESLFGPVSQDLPLSDNEFDEMSDEEKAQVKKERDRVKSCITKGYNRIVEKVKEIRQSFSKAVVSGTRSGCGKIVFEFYEKLVTIWGGSANTEPLSFGISSETLNNKSGRPQDELSENENDDFDDVENSGSQAQKRKSTENAVPLLVDNKRKHLEKNLSAAERDKILINEAKEDKDARNNFTAAMKESNECFLKAMECMSKSVSEVGAGISRSLEVLAHAASANRLPQQQHPVNQNIFHQGIHPNYLMNASYAGCQPNSVPGTAATSSQGQRYYDMDQNNFFSLND